MNRFIMDIKDFLLNYSKIKKKTSFHFKAEGTVLTKWVVKLIKQFVF